MNLQTWPLLIGLLLVSPAFASAEPPGAGTIGSVRENDVLFLNAKDLAKVLNWELKIVDPRGLVTFCREQNGGVCIPVRLVAGNHRWVGEQLLLDVDAVRRALRFRVVETGDRITVAANTAATAGDSQSAIPAFHAEWGRKRGFGKGDTLPDIPLIDVDGKEVRFSQFLGKRYILYCWASW